MGVFTIFWIACTVFVNREELAYSIHFYKNEKQLRTEHERKLKAYFDEVFSEDIADSKTRQREKLLGIQRC